MYFPRRYFSAALFALLALPVAASAQTAAPAKLVTGTWTGKITTPGNPDPTDITFEVTYKADTLSIDLVAGEHGKFALNDIKLSDKKLTFFFTPGPKVVCELNVKEAGYAGDCKDDDGAIVPLTMLPPAKPAKT